MKSVKSWKTDKTALFYIRKEDKNIIKRKIDRYLADFFETDKKGCVIFHGTPSFVYIYLSGWKTI